MERSFDVGGIILYFCFIYVFIFIWLPIFLLLLLYCSRILTHLCTNYTAFTTQRYNTIIKWYLFFQNTTWWSPCSHPHILLLLHSSHGSTLHAPLPLLHQGGVVVTTPCAHPPARSCSDYTLPTPCYYFSLNFHILAGPCSIYTLLLLLLLF